MTAAPAPTVTPELKQVLRRLKLGKMLDTLPERLVLAKQNKLAHVAFLELVLADEIDRRDRTGATHRARTAGLSFAMKAARFSGVSACARLVSCCRVLRPIAWRTA